MDISYENDVIPILVEVDQKIKKIIFEMSPLYKKEFDEMQDVTVPLFTALHSTSESILVLLEVKGIFDADILLRSVMEGTIKYCYLMNGTKEVKLARYNEYKSILTEIGNLEDHKKALETISILREFAGNTKPFECSVLSEQQLDYLNEKYSRKKRNEIKKRWSYGSLLRELASNSLEYRAQLGSLSTYSLTSHNGHFDWIGFKGRAEQMEVDHKENELLDVAHAMRIISNLLTCYLFRVAEYIRGNSYSNPRLVELCIQAYELTSNIQKFQCEIVDELSML